MKKQMELFELVWISLMAITFQQHSFIEWKWAELIKVNKQSGRNSKANKRSAETIPGENVNILQIC